MEENAGVSICRRNFSQGSYSNIIFPLIPFKLKKTLKSVHYRKEITPKKEPLAGLHRSELPDTYALKDLVWHFYCPFKILFRDDGATVTSIF